MDFSAFNPSSSNSLNLAARTNDVSLLKKLLKKTNPNCVDNRGWTCLHEAAANDSYESLILILNHVECRPLTETFEGHTALYLACQKQCSIKTIEVLLENVEDIANYASTEMVTPLHVVSAQGRLQVIQLLLDYGAIIDVQDFDGDTALHDAAFSKQHEVVSLLLHAGAESETKNDAHYTPLHLACFKGCLQTVKAVHSFISDINIQTANGETALILATQNGSTEVVRYLLQNNADVHLKNVDGELALKIALVHGHSDIFKMLLDVTDRDKINKDIILLACKPHYFNMDIIISLLESDLGPEFFNLAERFYVTLEKLGSIRPVYTTNAPLNSFLHISEYIFNQSQDLFNKLFYLFLMRGVAVNALYINECPPLVYIHYCEHSNCFNSVLSILIEQGCNVDYHSTDYFPDSFIASLATGASTAPYLLPYSLECYPEMLLKAIVQIDLVGRISLDVQNKIISMVDGRTDEVTINNFSSFVSPLKHLCRIQIKRSLIKSGIRSTKQFLNILENQIHLPKILCLYLRYL